jgi:hypothetical protein
VRAQDVAVVAFPAPGVGQDGVGFGDLGEAGRGVRVGFVDVGVGLAGEGVELSVWDISLGSVGGGRGWRGKCGLTS